MITRRKNRNGGSEPSLPPNEPDLAASVATETPPAPAAPPSPAAPVAPVAPASPTARGRRRTESAEPAAVNLLSPWVLEELRVVRLRNRFVLGGVALVLLIGLAWAGLNLRLNQVEEEARSEEQVASTLSAQIADLSDVRAYVGAVQNRATTVEGVLASTVRFSRALSALDGALPAGASFDTLTVTLPAGGSGGETEGGADGVSATCPGPDPFGAVPVVACLQLTGTAADREGVSRLVQALDRDPVFVEPFVATTSRGEERGVSFTGSVGLTAKVLADPASAADDDAAPGSTPTPDATEGGQ